MYQLYQWMVFFYFYCFCGWIWETTYVSICQRKFVNRGFLHGPWIPLYGSGAVVMLFLALPVRDNLILTYLAGFIGPTILELVTGWAMEKIFKVRYWDYSKQKFQFHGYICLKSSLFWGVMTVVMVRWVHDPVEKLVLRQPQQVLIPLVILLTVLFVIDFAVSTKEALSLRKLLVGLEKLRTDMERVQSELSDRLEESREQLSEMLEENRRQVEARLEEGRERMAETREENRVRREETKAQVEAQIEEAKAQRAERREETKAQVEAQIEEAKAQRAERREETKAQVEAQIEESRTQRAERREERNARMEEARQQMADLLEDSRQRTKQILDDTHAQITDRMGNGHFQISGMMNQTRGKIAAMLEDTRVRLNALAQMDRSQVENDVDELKMMVSLEEERADMEKLFEDTRVELSERMEKSVQTVETLQKEIDDLENRNEVELGELRLAHRKLLRRHPSARAGRWEEILAETAHQSEEKES